MTAGSVWRPKTGRRTLTVVIASASLCGWRTGHRAERRFDGLGSQARRWAALRSLPAWLTILEGST